MGFNQADPAAEIPKRHKFFAKYFNGYWQALEVI
jgi:hypothetical protein